jgi:hypothetical protein
MAMVTTTNSAAGADRAEKKHPLVSLYPRLRFIEIATGTNDASSVLWPCLEFEDSNGITSDVRKAVNMKGLEDMALVRSMIRRLSSNQGTTGPVALLLGKNVPNQNRCVWFQGELLNFMDNFFIVLQSCEDVVGLKDAMEVTESIIEASIAANDSTTADGHSDVLVIVDVQPKYSSKAAAVENPPDQGNAVEAKSTAALNTNTGSSRDEETTVPQKASIDSLSKVEEAIVPPTEPSTKSDSAVQPRNIRASSSTEEIAPKEPPIESKQKKMRASSLSRKRPKIAEAARVSMSAALIAEETLQPEQDSPITDSSATSSTQTRRTLHSFGSKRKSSPTVALSDKK